MAKRPEVVEKIGFIDYKSIKPGEIVIDDEPRKWRPVGRGKGEYGNHLLVLEEMVNPKQEGSRAILEKYPNYDGELLVDMGARLKKDKDGCLIVEPLKRQRGIWRVLRSDYHMEVYCLGDMAYSVTIRTLAYERARLALIRGAFPELFGAGN